MNPGIQLAFPYIPAPALDEAIKAVRDMAPPHVKFEQFVGEVAEHILGQRPGTVILCAAPVGVDCNELICEVATQVVARHQAREGVAFAGLRVVSTPSAMRLRKNSEQSFLDAYYHSQPALPGDEGEQPLEIGYGCSSRSFYSLANVLKRKSVGAYIVTNVDRLKTHRGMPGVIEGLRMFHDIAEQSHRTHVLMGSVTEVLDWLLDPDVASGVESVILAPYDVDEKDGDGQLGVEAEQFRAVLACYDSVIPWLGDESLVSHCDEIARTVSGSPWRLRKWIGGALDLARNRRESGLSWLTFVDKQPKDSERMQAWRELCAVRRCFGREEIAATDTDGRKKVQYPPGIRKPTRDPVAA